jgi:mono/diheme cytochrome c family protein
LTAGVRLTVLAAAAVGLAVGVTSSSLASGGAEPSLSTSRYEAGKRLYRKFCGQCHALREARAVGFGTNNRFGKEGGPSFNTLRVPYRLSVALITQKSNGHERLVHKLTWAQVTTVADFVATATKDHPFPALPTDG